MKKVLAMILAAIMIFSALPMLVSAEAVSGTCGENVAWELDYSAGILTISGTGSMANYTVTEPAPWNSYRGYVECIVVDEGITTIGDYAFEDFYSLKAISVPVGVGYVGVYAFSGCDSLKDIYCAGEQDDIQIQYDGNQALLGASISMHFNHVCEKTQFVDFEDAHPHYAVYKCVCNKVNTVTSETEEFEEVVDEAVAPTCTATGLTEGKKCSVCDEIIVEQTVVNALGHSFGEWIVEKEAEYQVAGSETRTCATCKETETRVIPAIPYRITISTPSRTELKCQFGLILHANLDGEIPAGARIIWSRSNSNFETETVDADSFKIVSKKNGPTDFTASLVDVDGRILASDTITINSKAEIVDIILGYILSFFNLTKVHKN